MAESGSGDTDENEASADDGKSGRPESKDEPPRHDPERRGSARRPGGRRAGDRRGKGSDEGDEGEDEDGAGDKGDDEAGDDEDDKGDKGDKDDKDKGDKDKGDKSKGDKGKGDKKKKPSPLRKTWVRVVIAIVVVLLLIALAVWLVHYFTRGRYVQGTNDAYVKADSVVLTATVAARVERIAVGDNQPVRAGDVLIQLDTRSNAAKVDQYAAQAAEARAEADQYRSEMSEQDATVAQYAAQARAADVQRAYYTGEVRRYTPLVAGGAEKDEQLAQYVQQRDAAAEQVAQYRAAELSARRKIATLRTQVAQADAKVEQAVAQSKQASVDVDNSIIRAPVDGRVGNRQVSAGAYVSPGSQLITVVPIDAIYVEANFKETQLDLMRIGQPVEVRVDALGGMKIPGEVMSFQPSTGAEFSVLPAQNATGNFTKIVQRVPVRIRIDAGAEARKVLLPGLSVVVEVDTVGNKDDKDRRKEEQRDDKRVDQRQHDTDVKRDRGTREPGPGR